ncbi:LysR family transcriptional regulator [uncultured Endozoicomonas sp.]|uniref:LysR family transcriptional regulator n=1 Tax=uncultured Endozoicomonas sp. TaxID=432652 RepID=UPI002611C565|nr:LysR family transcriptional regulator [uncultured Endozoicomonas sp.]
MRDLNRIDLNLLRIFDLLMTEGSVSRTAEKLNLSQSTISHALSRLRRQFNDDLFVPVYGGMAPTDQARLISPAIRQAMLLLEQSLTNVSVFEPEESEATFRIAGGDYVELIIVPALMGKISGQAPNIKLEIKDLKATDYSQELETRAVDLVVGFEKSGRLSKNLKSTRFLSERLVLVSPEPIHDASAVITADAIRALRFIYPSIWGHSQALMDEWCERHGIQRTIAIHTTGFLAVPELMQKLGLVTVLPAAVAKYYADQFNFSWYQIEDSELSYQHLLAWHPLRDKDQSLLWLKKQLLHVAKTIEVHRIQ